MNSTTLLGFYTVLYYEYYFKVIGKTYNYSDKNCQIIVGEQIINNTPLLALFFDHKNCDLQEGQRWFFCKLNEAYKMIEIINQILVSDFETFE